MSIAMSLLVQFRWAYAEMLKDGIPEWGKPVPIVMTEAQVEWLLMLLEKEAADESVSTRAVR